MNYTEKGSLILDGRDVAKKIQASLKEEIQKKNVKITLATVLVLSLIHISEPTRPY